LTDGTSSYAIQGFGASGHLMTGCCFTILPTQPHTNQTHTEQMLPWTALICASVYVLRVLCWTTLHHRTLHAFKPSWGLLRCTTKVCLQNCGGSLCCFTPSKYALSTVVDCDVTCHIMRLVSTRFPLHGSCQGLGTSMAPQWPVSQRGGGPQGYAFPICAFVFAQALKATVITALAKLTT
jgi:hypothetical protein